MYKRQDETGNTGTVEIMEKRIMGKLKEEEIMCKVISLSLIHISLVIAWYAQESNFFNILAMM